MVAPNPIIVADVDGVRGTVNADQFHSDVSAVAVALPDGQTILIPLHLLVKHDSSTYYFPHSLLTFRKAQTEPPSTHSPEELRQTVIPVIEEDVQVGKRWVETGRVRISKVVREEEQVIDETLLKDEVEVEHRPINRVLDTPAEPRQDGNTLIIPVMEEMLVVEKRLVLKEEIHVTRRQRAVPTAQNVTIRKEDVIVERVEPERSADDSIPSV
mgnify:CR=1 FL=1